MTTGLTTPDAAALEGLFDLEDPDDCEMLKELYEYFLVEGIGELRRLSPLMELGKLHEVDEIAHKLKSSLGNVGLGASSDICDGIMQKARAGEESGVRQGVERLAALIGDMENGIRDFMRQL